MKQSKTRLPVLITCLLVLLAPAWVFALNLGDINLKSEPGRPLEAEIPLSGVSAEEQDSLSVGLADVAGFRWAGIEWSPALNQLQFELTRGADGADYIRVHSDEAVRTPVLHFLLKVAWSRGRLFREYTLELDTPPSVSGDTPAAAVAVEDDWKDARAAVRETRRYEVVRNDTLWEIARELRPDSSVSIQQMMLALLRTNPDAFSHGNINWLKAGADLWMPSDFEMQALSAADAFAEVLVQNNVWREARGLPAVDTGWLAGTGTIAVDGGLRLVPVGEGDLEDDSVAAAEADGASREQALALANEQVEELSQENIELEHNLAEAETIIEDLRRLVELKDDELAALQGQSVGEDADPGPGLTERLKSFHDATIKPAYNLARDNWYIVLAGLALLLVGWLLLRRRAARAPKGFSVPAASVRTDFVKVTRPEEAASPPEDDAQQEEEEDQAQNKLDLARAYLELDDTENARAILNEVISEGNAAQREEARQLLEQANSG